MVDAMVCWYVQGNRHSRVSEVVRNGFRPSAVLYFLYSGLFLGVPLPVLRQIMVNMQMFLSSPDLSTPHGGPPFQGWRKGDGSRFRGFAGAAGGALGENRGSRVRPKTSNLREGRIEYLAYLALQLVFMLFCWVPSSQVTPSCCIALAVGGFEF